MKVFLRKFLSIFCVLWCLIINTNAEGTDIEKISIPETNQYIIEFKTPPLCKIKKRRLKNFRSNFKNAINAQKTIFNTTRSKLNSDLKPKHTLKNQKRNHSKQRRFKKDFNYLINGVVLTLNKEELHLISKLPYIKKIYPDRKVSLNLNESDSIIKSDIFRQTTGATGDGIVVAIIDTGIDYLHPDLGGGIGASYKVIGGYDFINDDTNPMDDNGHGTHCAGIVAANGTVKGIAPDAKLLAYKVLNTAGNGIFSDIIAALERAADPDNDSLTDDAADIISISIGGYGDPDDPISQAVDNAVEQGIICVIAAGNEKNYYSITSPGCARNAITVGACDKENRIAYFSSKGPTDKIILNKPDVLAPGVDIYSTLPDSTYGYKSGTSMATPHVSGAAALMLEKYPFLKPLEIKNLLRETAVSIGEDTLTQGGGLIDLENNLTVNAVISPSSVYFGGINHGTQNWQTDQILNIKNLSDSPQIFNIDWQSNVSVGIDIDFDDTVMLNIGESVSVPIGITITSDLLPLSEEPYTYEGNIVFSNLSDSYKVQFVFHKEKPDPYEPNNTNTQSTPIEISTARTILYDNGRTKIDSASGEASTPDYDWFSFYAESGDLVTIDINARDIASPLDSKLTVFNQTETELITNNEYHYHDDPMIRDFLIPDDGNYFIKVQGENFSEGAYHLIYSKSPENVLWNINCENTKQTSFLNQGAKTLITQLSKIQVLDNNNSGLQLWEKDGLDIVLTKTSRSASTIAILNKTVSDQYQLLIYDSSSSIIVWQYLFPTENIPSDLDVSSDGNTIAVYTQDTSLSNIIIYVFSKSSSYPIFTFTQPTTNVNNIGFEISSNGSLILFSDNNKTYILDKNLQSLRWSGECVDKAFRLNSDGQYIAGSQISDRITLKQWNGLTYEKVWDFYPGNANDIFKTAISGNGQTIVTTQRITFGSYGLEDSGLLFHILDKSSNTPIYTYQVEKQTSNTPRDDLFGIKVPNAIDEILCSQDGQNIAITTWGADPEEPEVFLFNREYPLPSATYYTHGSVQDADMIGNKLCFFSEGKHRFHFFRFGMEQNIVSLNLEEYLNPIPPFIQNIEVNPKYSTPGSTVTVSANVTDSEGISVVTTEVYIHNGAKIGSIELLDNGSTPDINPNDNIFTGSFTTPASPPENYSFFIKAKDLSNNTAISEDHYFTTASCARIILLDTFIIGDVSVHPGEKSNICFLFKNIGQIPTDDLLIKIFIQDQYVDDYYMYTLSFPSIPQSGTFESPEDTFFITPSYDTPDCHTFNVTILINGENNLSDKIGSSLYSTDTTPPHVVKSSVNPKYLEAGENLSFKISLIDGSQITETYLSLLDRDNESAPPISIINIYDDGNHNDEYPNDKVFGANWQTDTLPYNYKVNLFVKDAKNNSETHEDIIRFTTKPFTAQNSLLLVNDTLNEPSLIDNYTDDLSNLSVSFDLWDTEENGEIPPQVINQYSNGMVLWIVGNTHNVHHLSTYEQNTLIEYLNNNGNLLISGQRLSYFLSLGDKNSFLSDYICADFVNKDSNCLKVNGITGNVYTEGLSLNLQNQFYTGETDPILPAETFLEYDTLNGSGTTFSTASAAIQTENQKYRTLFFDFDFSGLSPDTQRRSLLEKIINYFSGPKITDIIVSPKISPPEETITISATVSDSDEISSVYVKITDSSDIELANLLMYDDGTHGDTTPDDFVYTNSWQTLSIEKDYFAKIMATDLNGNQSNSTHNTFFSTIPQPDFEITNVIPYDTDHFTPDMTTFFDISLENIGTQNSSQLTAELKITDPFVQYYSSTPRTISAINTGETVSTNYGVFYLRMSPITPDKHLITLSFTFKDESDKIYQTDYQIEIIDTTAPVLSYFNISPKQPSCGTQITISAKLLDDKNFSQTEIVIKTANSEKEWSLQLYDDGSHNDSEAGDLIFSNTFITDTTPYSYKIDIYVTDSAGNQSIISPVYRFTTIPFAQKNRILIIDDSDDLSDTYIWFRDFFAEKNLPFDLWKTKERNEITPSVLSHYNDGAVIWFTNKTTSSALSVNEIDSIKNFLDSGENLLFTGENNTFYITSTHGTYFLRDYFAVEYVNKEITIKKLNGVYEDPITDDLSFSLINTHNPGEIKVYSPAEPILYYDQSGGSGNILGYGIAASRIDNGTYKSVYLDFSWDNINSTLKRNLLLEQILTWFGIDMTPYLDTVRIQPTLVSTSEEILIEADINNSSSIKNVYANIESPDETTLNNIILFDDGSHGDKTADDNTFSRSLITDPEGKIYFVDISLKKTDLSTMNYDNTLLFDTSSSNRLAFAGYNNTQLQTGKTNYIALKIQNSGETTAINVTCTIHLRDEFINYYRTTEIKLGNIPPKTTVTDPQNSFYISLSDLCPDNYVLNGHITIQDSSGKSLTENITFTTNDLLGPKIEFLNVTPKQISPTEEITITAEITDVSGIDSVTAVISDFNENEIDEIFLYKENDTDIFSVTYATNDDPTNYNITLYAKDTLENQTVSDNSTWFTTIPFIQRNPLLVIIPQNDFPESHPYTDALQSIGYGYDVWDKGLRDTPNENVFLNYRGKSILFCNNRTTASSIQQEEQESLINHLDNDGTLLISGSSLVSTLTSSGYVENTLINDYLKTDYVTYRTYIDIILGTGGEILENDGFTITNDLAAEILVSSPAKGILEVDSTLDPTEVENEGYIASKIETDGYRAIILNFKFMDIEFPEKRSEILHNCLTWLNGETMTISSFQVTPIINAAGGTFDFQGHIENSDTLSSAQLVIKSSTDTELVNLYDDGAHNDLAPNDGIYGNQWVSPTEPDYFTTSLKCENNDDENFYFPNLISFSTKPVPWLTYDHYDLPYGDNFKTNITNYFHIYIKNIGNYTANNVKVNISSDSPYMSSVSSSTYVYGNIDISETKHESGSKFYLRTTSDCPNETDIKIHVTIKENSSMIFNDETIITVYDNTAPSVTGFNIDLANPLPGEQITISATVIDPSGISFVRADIKDFDGNNITSVPLYDDGLHNDDNDNDSFYANRFILPSYAEDFSIKLFAEDTLENSDYAYTTVWLTTKTFQAKNNILIVDQHTQNIDQTTPLQNTLIDLGYSYDIWNQTLHGYINTSIFQSYKCVIWDSFSASYNSFTSDILNTLEEYLDQDGNLILVGQRNIQYISDSGRKQVPLLNDYLNTIFIKSSASQKELKGVPSDIISDNLTVSLKYAYAGEIDPVSDAITILNLSPSYESLSTGSSGIRIEKNDYKAVVFDFPWDYIKDRNQKQNLLGNTLNWINTSSPRLAKFDANPKASSVSVPITLSAEIESSYDISSATIQIFDNENSPLSSLQLYDDGTHNDAAANDNIYTNTYTPTIDNMTYYIDFTCADTANNTSHFPKCSAFYTKPYPIFEFISYELKNAAPLKPGTLGYFGITIKNIGTINADSVELSLDIEDRYLNNFSQIPVIYGSVSIGEQKSCATNKLWIKPDYSCPDAHIFEVKIIVTDNLGNLSIDKFTVPVIDDIAPYIGETDYSENNLKIGTDIIIYTNVTEGSGIEEITAYIEGDNDGHVYILQFLDDGNEHDQSPNDNIYTCKFTTPFTPQNYSLQIYTEDSIGNYKTWDVDKKFTTVPFSCDSRILLVDDDGGTSNIEEYYKEMLDNCGYIYDYWDTNLRGEANQTLLNYYKNGCVLIFTGFNSSTSRISQEEQSAYITYLNSGGNIIMTGKNNSYLLTGFGNSQNIFLNDYMHAQYQQQSYYLSTVSGIIDEYITDWITTPAPFTGGNGGEIDPVSPATAILVYSGDSAGHTISSGTAALKTDTDLYKTVYFDFKLEDLTDQYIRTKLINKTLKWILGPEITNPEISTHHITAGSSIDIFCTVTDSESISEVSVEIESPDENVIAVVELLDDGVSPDQTAGDGIYSSSYLTPTEQNEYLVDISAENSLQNIGRLNNALNFSTKNLPYLIIESINLNEGTDFISGTNNYFGLTLTNEGNLNALSTTVKIEIDNLFIDTYQTDTVFYNIINSGTTVSSTTTAFFIDPDIFTPNAQKIPIFVTISCHNNGDSYIYTEQLSVQITDILAPIITNCSVTPHNPSINSITTIKTSIEEGSGVDTIDANIMLLNHTPIAIISLLDDGLHGDGQPNNYIFANDFNTGSTPADYLIDITTKDKLGNTTLYPSVIKFTSTEFESSDTGILLINADPDNEAVIQVYKDILTNLGIGFDYWDKILRGSISSSQISNYQYSAVIIATGENGVKNLAKTDYDLLREYLINNGNVFISGQNLSLWTENSPDANHFLNTHMYAYSVQQDTGLLNLSFQPENLIGFNQDIDLQNQLYKGEIDLINPAAPLFTYDPDNGGQVVSSATGAFCVQDDRYRAVFFDFGFEGILSETTKNNLMQSIINWLTDWDNDSLKDKWEINFFGSIASNSGTDDPDNDGLTNLMEQSFQTDPTLYDSDNDGQNDYQEQIAGTDPWDSSSKFQITDVIQENDGMTLIWDSIVDKNYDILFSNSTPIEDNFILIDTYQATSDESSFKHSGNPPSQPPPTEGDFGLYYIRVNGSD